MVYTFLILFRQSKHRFLILIALIYVFKDSLYQGFWIGIIIADMTKNDVFKNTPISPKPYQYTVAILFLYFSSFPNYVTQEFLQNTIYCFLPDDKGFGGGYPMLSAFLIFLLANSSNRFKNSLNSSVLQFLGNISYGIYVIHFLIIGSFSSWLFLTLIEPIGYHASFAVVLSTGLLFIIITAHISTKFIDTPSIKIASYIGKKVVIYINSAYLTNKWLKKMACAKKCITQTR